MASPLRPGDPERIGPFAVRARLGGGGMGVVYLGRSPGGHTVAVKAVHPDLADDPDFRRRFATEVAAARRVGGFYTAQVVDADPEAEPPWLATAYIPGPSLHEAVRDHGPLPPASVAALGAGLAEGLAAIHACGIVHRDLKPGNVLLAHDGPRVIDFGIARALDATSHTSSVLGTAAYMSPEQVRGDPVGPASDVFALGGVLAYAATGRRAFGEGRAEVMVYRIVQSEPDLTGIDPGPAALVAACLAKDPDARPGLDEVLRRFAPDAARAGEGPADGWLPEAVTEVIAERRNAVATTPPPSTPGTGPGTRRTASTTTCARRSAAGCGSTAPSGWTATRPCAWSRCVTPAPDRTRPGRAVSRPCCRRTGPTG
jgi:serine/threonine protein kinase